MSKVNKPPISLSRLIRYISGKVFDFNFFITLMILIKPDSISIDVV